MNSIEDPVLEVFELHSDDVLVVSDTKGTRNIQEGDSLYLDDEIISGRVEAYTVESLDYSNYIILEEDDEVFTVFNSLGIVIPKEVLDGLFSNGIHKFNSNSSDSE